MRNPAKPSDLKRALDTLQEVHRVDLRDAKLIDDVMAAVYQRARPGMSMDEILDTTLKGGDKFTPTVDEVLDLFEIDDDIDEAIRLNPAT